MVRPRLPLARARPELVAPATILGRGVSASSRAGKLPAAIPSGVPGPTTGAFRTRELAPGSWPDFEALFARNDGVQDGCWCMFYHRERPNRDQPRVDRIAQNRRDHRALVRRGDAHGILVYDGDAVVGWCQFGRAVQLPRIDQGRKYRQLRARLARAADWRITCFFVDRPYRRRGISTVALHAALNAIRRRGGGIVEAYPTTNRQAVAMWFGTVGMFHGEGFTRVADFGRSNVLMRRTVRAARRS